MIAKTQHSILESLIKGSAHGKRFFAVLIDPEDFDTHKVLRFLNNIPQFTTHIFIGGSTCTYKQTRETVIAVKQNSSLPVVLFPGSYEQISDNVDALLFLTLLSSNNPEFLISQQIKAVNRLQGLSIEIIPTGYILIDGGNETTVQRVSNTRPIPATAIQRIVHTALAGKFSGKQLIYLEAGSGAKNPISKEVIQAVKEAVQIPLIVGGGIKTQERMQLAHDAGADMVVVGTAFEKAPFTLK